jgi:alkylhydroperoxidase family enzyme
VSDPIIEAFTLNLLEKAFMPPTDPTGVTEPTFTLRASHAGAADCLNHHAATAEDLGAPKEYVAQVREAVEAFRAWPVSMAPGVDASEQLHQTESSEG